MAQFGASQVLPGGFPCRDVSPGSGDITAAPEDTGALWQDLEVCLTWGWLQSLDERKESGTATGKEIEWLSPAWPCAFSEGDASLP